MTFRPAGLDVVALAMTVSFHLAVVVALAIGFLGSWVMAALGTVLAAVACAFLALRPQRIALEGGDLSVHRGLGTTRIDGPLSAEPIGPADLFGARLLGSGGLWGYLGIFRPGDGRRYTSLITARGAAVLVRGPRSGAVVSPRDPDAFVAAIGGEVAHG